MRSWLKARFEYTSQMAPVKQASSAGRVAILSMLQGMLMTSIRPHGLSNKESKVGDASAGDSARQAEDAVESNRTE